MTIVRLGRILVVGITAFSSLPAVAASRTWDASGTLPIDGGSGAWDLTSLRWWNGATFEQWNNSVANSPVFRGTGGNVTVDSGITTASVHVENATYTLRGVAPLTLADPAGLNIIHAIGAAAVLNIRVPFNVVGGAIHKRGAGSVSFGYASSNFTQDIYVDEGGLAFPNNGQNGGSPIGLGKLWFAEGTTLAASSATTNSVGFQTSVNADRAILNGPVDFGSGNLTVTLFRANGNSSIATVFAGPITSTPGARLTITGSGTLSLEGAATLQGPLSVNGSGTYVFATGNSLGNPNAGTEIVNGSILVLQGDSNEPIRIQNASMRGRGAVLHNDVRISGSAVIDADFPDSSPFTIDGSIVNDDPGAVLNLGPVKLRSFRAGSVRIGSLWSVDRATRLTSDSGPFVSRTGDLTIGTRSVLDIGSNPLIVDQSDDTTAMLERIRGYLSTGFSGGTWAGLGLVTSSASPSERIGYASADALGSSSSMFGEAIDPTTVIIRTSLAGDTNMNGKVDFDDLLRLAQNYESGSGKTWSSGDFDYNSVVDFADLLTLAQNYALGVRAAESDFRIARTLVPEPTFGVLCAFALFPLVRRRSMH